MYNNRNDGRNQKYSDRNNNRYNGGSYSGNNSREPKKDWRRRTTHQTNGLPKNERVEIPVSCYGITANGREYDGTTFIDLMEDLQNNDTFSKISIPVYINAKYITDDPKARFNTVIGYIKEFNTDTGDAVCIIYDKSIKVFHKIEDAIVVPRVAIKDGKCSCIIALDIVSKKDFEAKIK